MRLALQAATECLYRWVIASTLCEPDWCAEVRTEDAALPPRADPLPPDFRMLCWRALAGREESQAELAAELPEAGRALCGGRDIVKATPVSCAGAEEVRTCAGGAMFGGCGAFAVPGSCATLYLRSRPLTGEGAAHDGEEWQPNARNTTPMGATEAGAVRTCAQSAAPARRPLFPPLPCSGGARWGALLRDAPHFPGSWLDALADRGRPVLCCLGMHRDTREA